MNVLLLKPPYRNVYGRLKVASGNYFLLGLGYIASYLRQRGHNVYILDPEAQGLSYDDCAERTKSLSPGMIGISATTPDFANALKIAEIAKKSSNAFLLLGGIHGSSLPEHIISRYPKLFDAVCIGEGEEVSLEICEFLEGKIKSLRDIKGICFMDNGEVIKTQTREFIKDVDALPFPSRDLVSMDFYKPHAFNTRKGRTATMITSRGCPFRCTFCASKLTLGGKFRARSPENVLEEMEQLVKQYGVRHILIQDDTFTFDMDRAKIICRKIIEKKLNIEWFSFSQVTKVDDELLDLMREAGCYSIGFGIESVDSEVLKSIRKPISEEICKKSILAAKKRGLKVQAFFIFGNKKDTKETIEKTIDFACKTSPTLAFFNKLVAYPGTEIFEEHFGQDLDNTQWNDFVPMGERATVSNTQLSKHELERLVYKANLRFYLRPSQLLEILRSIRSLHEFKAYLRSAIGLFLQMLKWRNSHE